MPPPFLKDTVDISVQLPPGTSSVDVAKYIFDYFAGKYTVKSIQQCPGRIARVTFAEPEARVAVEELQRIDLNGVSCPIIVPMPPPPRYSFVYVYLYPFVGSDQPIVDFFEHYGEVDSVRFQHWTNLEEVSTGTRIVRMVRRNHIPRFVIINGFRCQVWYKGQPLKCDICSGDHKAASCPHKGKCIRCGEKGHFARNCHNAKNVSVPAAAAGPSNDPSADLAPADVVVDPPSSVDLPAADPATVVVVNEDSGVHPSVIEVDERFNQLDELASQDSESILQNCVVRQITYDFLSDNGINSSDNSGDNDILNSNDNSGIANNNDMDGTINTITSDIANSSSDNDKISDSNIPPVANSNVDLVSSDDCHVNHYGSAVAASSSDPPVLVDAEMSVGPDPRKRPLSDVSSSEEPIGEFSSDSSNSAPAAKSRLGLKLADSVLAVASKSKIPIKKAAKKPKGHLPAGVVYATRLLSRPKR